jgi:hypothetical protein
VAYGFRLSVLYLSVLLGLGFLVVLGWAPCFKIVVVFYALHLFTIISIISFFLMI